MVWDAASESARLPEPNAVCRSAQQARAGPSPPSPPPHLSVVACASRLADSLGRIVAAGPLLPGVSSQPGRSRFVLVCAHSLQRITHRYVKCIRCIILDRRYWQSTTTLPAHPTRQERMANATTTTAYSTTLWTLHTALRFSFRSLESQRLTDTDGHGARTAMA